MAIKSILHDLNKVASYVKKKSELKLTLEEVTESYRDLPMEYKKRMDTKQIGRTIIFRHITKDSRDTTVSEFKGSDRVGNTI